MALHRFSDSWEAVERLCRAVRYALRTAGLAAAPLIPCLAGELPAMYAATRHSAFLYIASQLAKVFGDAPQHDPALGAPFYYISSTPCCGLSSCASNCYAALDTRARTVAQVDCTPLHQYVPHPLWQICMLLILVLGALPHDTTDNNILCTLAIE